MPSYLVHDSTRTGLIYGDFTRKMKASGAQHDYVQGLRPSEDFDVPKDAFWALYGPGIQRVIRRRVPSRHSWKSVIVHGVTHVAPLEWGGGQGVETNTHAPSAPHRRAVVAPTQLNKASFPH